MMEVNKHKVKDIFVDGPIDPSFVGSSLAKHAARHDIGAHEIFLGQVRADVIPSLHPDLEPGRGRVEAIEYSTYREMALEQMTVIREEAFSRWPAMTCLHVHHSLGTIPAGQLCFMVFASAPHRQQAREAVAWVVDAIKEQLPIFGKEILTDDTHIWKHNS